MTLTSAWLDSLIPPLRDGLWVITERPRMTIEHLPGGFFWWCQDEMVRKLRTRADVRAVVKAVRGK